MTNQIYKNIVVGISGGIAAYKSAELVRGLIKAGTNVRVCMTAAAMQFITPLTFQALSGNPVHSDLLDTDAEAGMGHIELARWADMILIANTNICTCFYESANKSGRFIGGNSTTYPYNDVFINLICHTRMITNL